MSEGYDARKKEAERRAFLKERFGEEESFHTLKYILSPRDETAVVEFAQMVAQARSTPGGEMKGTAILVTAFEMRQEDETAKLRSELLGEMRVTEPQDEERFQAS